MRVYYVFIPIGSLSIERNNMAYVYRHIRLDTNQPFYIGIGSDSHFYRANAKANRTDFWKRIANKYGYKVEIVDSNIEWDDAVQLEMNLIKQYGRIELKTGTLVNMTDGGEYGTKGRVLTEDTKRKISEAQIGDKNHRFGKKMSEEERLLMIKSVTGLKRTNETREKISKARMGMKFSKETCEKIQRARKGTNHSEETKAKIAKASQLYWDTRKLLEGI
jgi:hypothetical protein